jgi:hypothetical protein
VRLLRAVRSGFHLKSVNGRVQICISLILLQVEGAERNTLHCSPASCLIICTNGLSGKQFSQTEGKSVVSHPERFKSCLICGGILRYCWGARKDNP